MNAGHRHTKIVATLGPATSSAAILRQMIEAGLDVVRLNFSHGTHEEHLQRLNLLRSLEQELKTPVTVLQDLQGPKVRIGQLPGGQITLTPGETVSLVPETAFSSQPSHLPVDFPGLASEVKPGTPVLLADGLFQMEVLSVAADTVRCRVIEGGVLKSRKGVNFPTLNLPLPALTDKDKQDLAFGLAHHVDWVCLSFVRSADDIRNLKQFMAQSGTAKPVIAKLEKPQAIQNLDPILDAADAIMVARGDLGVEMSPEKVPMLQKEIIERCNRRGIPVITATQMLESMVHEPIPTRAEVSDVANAIIDGTDAIMLSAESAVGDHPVRAVEVMVRIAHDVEGRITFKNYPLPANTETHALSEATIGIVGALKPCCIVVLTTTGHTATLVAAERPHAQVLALTIDSDVYHRLNLLWGIRPVLVAEKPDTFEGLVQLADHTARAHHFARPGDKILVLGGIPSGRARGTNFIKIHTLSG